MTPTFESGRAADKNGQLAQKLLCKIHPDLRLSSSHNSFFDGRLKDKIIEIKECKKKLNDKRKRSGSFTIKKKQHEKLMASNADYIFMVYDDLDLVFYLRCPAVDLPYKSASNQMSITWPAIPKLISGGKEVAASN